MRLESPFEAAAHETERSTVGTIERSTIKFYSLKKEQQLLSKRSFDTDPPTPIQQKMFVVCVADFNGVVPVRNDKTETKIKSRLGLKSYEQGDFLTLAQLWDQYHAAEKMLASNPDGFDKTARGNYSNEKPNGDDPNAFNLPDSAKSQSVTLIPVIRMSGVDLSLGAVKLFEQHVYKRVQGRCGQVSLPETDNKIGLHDCVHLR